MKRWIETACLAVVLGLGCYLLVDGVNRYRVGRASETWPETTVVVLETSTRKSSSRRSTSYRPVVRYRYSVDGTDFESRDLQAYPAGGSHAAIQKLLEQYPVGSEQTGYYNPEKPAQAVLVRGAHWKNSAQIGGALIAILIGACGILQRQRSAPDDAGDHSAEIG